jgi:hypothetical protein
VEAVQLASTSTARQLEAELAGKSQALAQFERDFKAEKATWAADVDTQQGEVRARVGRVAGCCCGGRPLLPAERAARQQGACQELELHLALLLRVLMAMSHQ